MDVIRAILRPAIQARVRTIEHSTGFPRPDSVTQAHTPGADPDRIPLIGNGALGGWGVSSHDFAIPGHLARELTARTGNPTVIDLVSDSFVTCQSAHSLLDGVRVAAYDAVVIVMGGSDAVQLLPSTRWEEAIGAFLGAIVSQASATTEIVIMGIAPLSTIPLLNLKSGRLVDHYAAQFNMVTKKYCTAQIHYLDPPVLERIGPSATGPSDEVEQRRVSAGHHEWAKTIAALLARLRHRNPAWP